MADHLEFVELASEMIAEDGRQITLQRLSSTAANSAKPWQGPGAPTVAQELTGVYAVFLPASSAGDLGLGKLIIDSELLKKVNEVALIAPQSTSIENFHLIVDDSKELKIEWMQVLRPANVTCLYVVGLNR